jgi:hypothetical protein
MAASFPSQDARLLPSYAQVDAVSRQYRVAVRLVMFVPTTISW